MDIVDLKKPGTGGAPRGVVGGTSLQDLPNGYLAEEVGYLGQ